MRKSDKKTDNLIRVALTDVCETALKEVVGFQWLTHLVNYNAFPQSLQIVCVFDTDENLETFKEKNNTNYFTLLINSKLNEVDVSLKRPSKHIKFDTEEKCLQQHGGHWGERLNTAS